MQDSFILKFHCAMSNNISREYLHKCDFKIQLSVIKLGSAFALVWLADWPKEQKANESWREHEKEDSTRVEVMSRVDVLFYLSFCQVLDLFQAKPVLKKA